MDAGLDPKWKRVSPGDLPEDVREHIVTDKPLERRVFVPEDAYWPLLDLTVHLKPSLVETHLDAAVLTCAYKKAADHPLWNETPVPSQLLGESEEMLSNARAHFRQQAARGQGRCPDCGDYFTAGDEPKAFCGCTENGET